ncbi:CSC1-like protein [Hibiscus syriacus]|uniref:CSC1-like protein n=1 Tax=Hibiscus syriacus TaxID=106335 RepID=A0A6A2YQH5_HIBSY|nr:CSC1-like protein [Hibiscus syriacus]
MANLRDISVSAALNLLSAFAFLVAFAILRLQPINDRVYFPKWYRKGARSSPSRSGPTVNQFVNLDWKTYIRFLNWMPAALGMPEPELIDHAGLDSVVYIRIYLLGLKIIVPLAVLAFLVLVPVNWTGETLESIKNLTFSDIDKLSISNVPDGSKRFWAHIVMSYVFALWTFYVLYVEYKIVASMRLKYLASEIRRPDQFTVLVRNIPPDPDESVSEHVEHFFRVNHPDFYLTHQVVYNANKLAELVEKKKSLQNWYTYYLNKYERTSKSSTTRTGFCGLFGDKVDAIDYYSSEIQKLSEAEASEREKVLSDPNAIVPAAFVSFKSRWSAAICAQTQQSHDPTIWLTEWAPEPRDVYWSNLAIPYFDLTIRRLLMAVALFFLIFFFMVPIAFVQSLANIDGIEKVFPFLRRLIEKESVKSFIQGFLPGIVLKIFLILLPTILMTMSKIEGFPSRSSLDRRSAGKYHLFLLVNVFLGSIITGAAFEHLKIFLHQPPTENPQISTFNNFPPEKYVFSETEQDREEAMDPGCLNFATYEPRIQLYFLLGLVYSAVTPVLLPFIIIFFAFAYVVFRHQVINVYDQKYESGGSFWPDVHRRLIIGLLISQLLLMGLLSTKNIEKSTIALIPLPIMTIWFHVYCKGRFESAFVRFPLQDAMIKDTLERATEPTLNLKDYLKDAYIHPVFKGRDYFESPQLVSDEESNTLVMTTRMGKHYAESIFTNSS